MKKSRLILTTWAGTEEVYQYSKSEIKYWRMMKSQEGDIWYFNHGTPRKLSFWCGGPDIVKHLARLYRQNNSSVTKI